MSCENKIDFDSEVPRVYIACLASYNAGILHGDWVDVPEDLDELQEEIDRILKASPIPNAEEWAIHDFEYFSPFKLSEYEDMETVIKYAAILNDLEDYEKEAFPGWEDLETFQDRDKETILENFRDAFIGTFDSGEDYAREFVSDCYNVDEWVERYLDYSAIWRDMDDYEGDNSTYGNVHIFRSCY